MALIALCVVAITGLLGVSAIGMNMFLEKMQLGRVTLPTLEELNSGVMVYDRDGKYVCTLREDGDRKPVPLSKISKNAQNAVVAVEDHRFHEHFGIDPWAIIRAFRANQEAGRVVEGGSTLTQQLVKNLYLDPNDKSYTRKIREAFMAVGVDSNYSKEKILETYLNVAYFGSGVSGIERAAQHYFNKHADQLTLGESAFLAGLLKAPTTLSLEENRAKAIERQHVILNDMQEFRFATPRQVAAARAERLVPNNGPRSKPWPHYMGVVVSELKRELGNDLWRKSWKVYTHFDPKAQTLAQNALNNGIAHAPKGINQGALVSMSLEDGGVIAIVGGAGDYEKTQWNRALNPHTAGSAFKPFVYLAALMSGAIQPDTLILDAPVKIEIPFQKAYEPKNYDGTFKGWMPARSALMQSRNVCAIRVAQKVGIPAVIETAQLAGIKSQLDSYLPLALGCCAVTPLEMATSYGTIARGGIYMPAQIIKRIETDKGLVYRSYKPTPSANLPPEPSLQMVDVLVDAVRGGTGRRAYLGGKVPVAGKTGTANKSKDLWFVGFTPEVVTAVWGGNDLNKDVAGHKVTGGVVIAGIWKDYMSGLLQTHKPKVLAFAQPGDKLAYDVPQYDPQSLLYPGMSVSREQAIAACWQIDNTAALDKISKDGVVRAVELQRNEAIKKFRSMASVPQAVGPGQYGVTNNSQQYAAHYPGNQYASQQVASQQYPQQVAQQTAQSTATTGDVVQSNVGQKQVAASVPIAPPIVNSNVESDADDNARIAVNNRRRNSEVEQGTASEYTAAPTDRVQYMGAYNIDQNQYARYLEKYKAVERQRWENAQARRRAAQNFGEEMQSPVHLSGSRIDTTY